MIHLDIGLNKWLSCHYSLENSEAGMKRRNKNNPLIYLRATQSAKHSARIKKSVKRHFRSRRNLINCGFFGCLLPWRFNFEQKWKFIVKFIVRRQCNGTIFYSVNAHVLWNISIQPSLLSTQKYTFNAGKLNCSEILNYWKLVFHLFSDINKMAINRYLIYINY